MTASIQENRDQSLGVTPAGSGYSAKPEPEEVSAADAVSIPNAAAFAKLFDTPHGQLLVFLDETSEGEPSITVIGARVRGVVARATLSGWPEGEEAQLRNFAKTTQEMANDFAARLHDTADRMAPPESGQ